MSKMDLHDLLKSGKFEEFMARFGRSAVPYGDPCEREWDMDGWHCRTNQRKCIHNNGMNTCLNEDNDSITPLKEEP